MKKYIDKWIIIYSVLFSVMTLFTIKTTVGDIFSSMEEAYIKPFALIDIFIFIIIFILSFIIFSFITFTFDKTIYKEKNRKNGKKFLLIILLSLLIIWIPYLLSFYPGGLFADTYTSIRMALHELGLNNKHPMIYSLTWRVILRVFNLITSNKEFPLFIFTLIQYISMSITCSLILFYMYKKECSKVLITISFIFFAFFPLIPLYTISLWKDTLFSVWIILYSLFFLYVFNSSNPVDTITKKRNIFLCLALCFLVSFGRNNGIYIVLVMLIITFIYLLFKEKSKRVIVFIVLNILNMAMIFFVQGPLYNHFQYNVDRNIESFGVPFQQVAYISSTSKLDKEDIEFINNIIPLEDLKETYRPMNFDPIKWHENFNQEFFDSNISNFMKLYMKLIIKHPVKAIKAYALQTVGYWNIRETSSVGYIQDEMWYPEPYHMTDIFKNIFGISIKNILSPNILFNYAIFIWILLYTIFYLLHNKKYNLIVPLLPILLLWGTIMVATPIAFSLRYVYPIVLGFPIYLFCLFYRKKS